VLCGAPIYDYDHIAPFSEEQSHEIDNLTLLCPNHHREKSARRLPVDRVKEANSSPRNKMLPHTAYHKLYFGESSFRLRLGGTWFHVRFDIVADKLVTVMIDEQPLFSFRREAAKVLLDLLLYDKDGGLLLEVGESELRHSTGLWDVEFTGTRLAIRPHLGEISVEMILHPPDGIELTRASFYCNGQSIFCEPTAILDENRNGVVGGRAENFCYGIVMGRNSHQYAALASFG
jgi:trigger factor